MIDNPRSPRVRSVAKLAKRNAREETGLFLVEGPQAVVEALSFHADQLVDLYITPQARDRYGDLIQAATAAGLRAELVSDAVLDVMSDTVTPQGVLATCRQFPISLDDLLATKPRLVAILEEVRDPGNAGTIIRAADAAGAGGVIFTGNSVDAYNPKVVRSTTGSIFHVPVAQNGTLDEALAAVRAAGLQVLVADVKGADLPKVRGILDRADGVGVRQRGARTHRRESATRGPGREGADLRPRRVAQPRDGGLGLPVRVGVRATFLG